MAHVYRFGDLEVASEISILDDLNSVIASVSYERKTVVDNNELAQEDAKRCRTIKNKLIKIIDIDKVSYIYYFFCLIFIYFVI